jgi:hypothetical protein
VYELCNRLRAPKNHTRVHFESVGALTRLGLAGVAEEDWNAEQAISFCVTLRETLHVVLEAHVDVRNTRAMLESDRERILNWIDEEVRSSWSCVGSGLANLCWFVDGCSFHVPLATYF